jgi:hypothetical protein
LSANRKTATVVGALYILGTAAGILSVVFTQPILNGPDFLIKVSAHQNQFILGALSVLTMGFALALVPVVLYPVVKKQNEALALGYVVFRGALETFTYIVSVITWLFLLLVSQEYRAAGATGGTYFQLLGAVLLKGNDSVNTILIFVFGLGALILYYLFYRSKLVPRWISVWGFIAIVLHLTTGFLILFQVTGSMSMVTTAMNLPILFQELVMAVWLIAKGFNPSVIASQPAKVDMN